MKTQHSIGDLARMAGVSIRTLRYYDKIGLLKPSERARSRYRYYGEGELLRLQQILFYKELDFSLKEIKAILDDPHFDVVKALESHKTALKKRKNRIDKLLVTINNTISNLEEGTMLNHDELYEGLPKEKTEAWRNEAIEKWGEDTIEHSETSLKKMTKAEFNKLKDDFTVNIETLVSLMTEDPKSDKVQAEIAKHYVFIQKFWGRKPNPEAYKGLGQLYVSDNRYTKVNGKPNPEFAEFMSKAMSYFVDTRRD